MPFKPWLDCCLPSKIYTIRLMRWLIRGYPNIHGIASFPPPLPNSTSSFSFFLFNVLKNFIDNTGLHQKRCFLPNIFNISNLMNATRPYHLVIRHFQHKTLPSLLPRMSPGAKEGNWATYSENQISQSRWHKNKCLMASRGDGTFASMDIIRFSVHYKNAFASRTAQGLASFE